MKILGQLVQVVVGGALLGVAVISVWTLLSSPPAQLDDGLADPKAPARVFRYQSY